MKTTRTVYTCDRCSVEMPESHPLCVQIGWQAGVSGQEPLVRDIYLCHPCAMVALQRVCNMAADFTQAEAFIKAAINPTPLKKSELP